MTIPEVQRVRDQRIDTVVPLMSPALLHHELPLTADLHDTVLSGRRQVEAVLNGDDPRVWAMRTGSPAQPDFQR